MRAIMKRDAILAATTAGMLMLGGCASTEDVEKAQAAADAAGAAANQAMAAAQQAHQAAQSAQQTADAASSSAASAHQKVDAHIASEGRD